MTDEWLTLTETAELLGIHPGTVRQWSDQGRLPVYRTEGGHRRYLRSEIELWKQSQADPSQPAELNQAIHKVITQLHFRVDQADLERQPFTAKFRPETRRRLQDSGMVLTGGLVRYLTGKSAAELQEAALRGTEYGDSAQRAGMNRLEALRSYLYFRKVLFESLARAYEQARIQTPAVWGEIMRRAYAYTEEVMLALLERYEPPTI